MHASSAVLAFSNRYSVFVWTGENDSKTLRVDVFSFRNGEKNSFLNENEHVWTGPKSLGLEPLELTGTFLGINGQNTK